MPKLKADARSSVEPTAKVANLLALLLTKDATAEDQIVLLARAGFTHQEIGDLTGSTRVRQTLYDAAHKSPRKRKATRR